MAERLSRMTESMVTRDQRYEQRFASHMDTLHSGRPYEAAGKVGVLSDEGMTNDQLKDFSLQAAIAELQPKLNAGQATKQDVYSLAKLKYSTAKRRRFTSGQEGLTALERASERGAYLSSESAAYPQEQQLAMKERRPYQLTKQQVYSRMLQDGSVPKELIPIFGSIGPENVLGDERIPGNVKQIFESRLSKQHYGPQSMRGGPGESKTTIGQYLKSLGIGALDVISSGGRFVNGMAAGYTKALRESEIAKELRVKGGDKFLGIPRAMMPMTNIPYTPMPVPNPDFIAQLAQDPSSAGRALLAHASAGIDGIVAGTKGIIEPWVEVGDRPELGQVIAEAGVHYRQEALQMAYNNRRPEDTKEEVFARAKNIYQSLIENDTAEMAIKYPMGSSIALELIADPLNWFGGAIIKGGAKAISTTWNVSKSIPLAGQVPKILGAAGTRVAESGTVQGAKRAFVAGPWDTKAFAVSGEAELKGLAKPARKEIRRAMMAARDRGRAHGTRVAGIGSRIDDQLARLKDAEVEDAFDLMEMYGKGKSDSVVKFHLEKMIQDPKRQAVVGKVLDNVRKLSDQLYKESAAVGQLNDIRKIINPKTGKATGHAIVRANYLEGYVPHRVFEGVGDLTEKLNKAGFPDVESARIAMQLSKAEKAGNKVEVARLKEMLDASGGSRGNILMLTSEEYTPVRAILHRIGDTMSDPDILGQTATHRIRAVGDAAKVRKGAPGAVKDLRVQWSAHIAKERTVAERAGEIDELYRFMGKNQTLKSLANGEPIKFINAGKKVTEKLRYDSDNAIAAMSDQLGVQMGTLDPELGRRFMQMTGRRVDPNKTMVVMPKMMAGRINEIFPRMAKEGTSKNVAVEQALGVVKGFSDYFIKPINAWWRPVKTVTRSLSFHATNIGGAVGLGVLAHGMRAFNPMLQHGAARVAVNAALTGTGSKKLAGKMFTLNGGQKVSLGHLQDVMARYNIIGQSGLRYGSQIPGGRGPIQVMANLAQKVAQKTRMQQVAAFGDDYQHSVAFMGWVKRNAKLKNGKLTDDDIYKAVDFTSEYAGNYGRLTAFEKTAMRDTFAFYSWNRFILPHLFKQVVKHPGRLAAFEKFQRGMQAYTIEVNGGRAVPAEGVPDHLQLSGGVVAPEAFQPNIEPGKPGSHTMAIMNFETPLAGFSAFAPGYGGGSPITAQYGPAGLFFAMALNGFDPSTSARGAAYGSKSWFGLPSLHDIAHNFNDPEDIMTALENVADSRVGQQAVGMVPFGEAMTNLSRLYIREGMYDEATELHMRYRAGRDFMGLDRLAAGAMGFKPLSVGTWVPGAKIYPVDPYQVAARRKSRAMAELPKNIID